MKLKLIVLVVLMNTFYVYSQNFIKELSEKTVGKFLYNENVTISNDSIDIFIKVNEKGYCYAVDFVTNDKIKYTLTDEILSTKVDKTLVWMQNDSIITESLKYDEYQSWGDYFSNRGRNHRYDAYAIHSYSKELIYVILNSEYGYAVLVEPENTDFLTENISDESYGESIIDQTIKFSNLKDGLQFLNSDEVKNKGIELQNNYNEIVRKENELKAIPIDSIELPYKIRFGMTELEFEKYLTILFRNFKKELQDEISYREAFKKGIYKNVVYDIKDGETLLRMQLKFFHNKLFFIGYAHLDKYNSNIEELDKKVEEKLKQIKVENLLFDIYTQYNEKQIWSIKEKENFHKEEQELMNSIYEAKKQNSIGKKM